MSPQAAPEASLLAAGDAALHKGEWVRARDAFRAALEVRESPAALEGLGRATWWLDDLDTTFPARQRAFQLYREAGDDRGAARIAMSLAFDYIDALAEMSVGEGWLQRAVRLLDGLERSADHGWLNIYQAFFVVEGYGDYQGGLALAREARDIGREFQVFDLEMLGAAGEGYSLLRAGEVAQGLRLMDEATAAAISGEISDLTVIGATCCALMYSCEAIGDYPRSAQWSARTSEFCKRWNLRSFFSVCRVYYASNLIQRGEWALAEAELRDLIESPEFARSAVTEDAQLKLSDLRRRQGRFAEAEALMARAPHKPLAIIGQARIALERDEDPVAAADLADRFLRRIGDEDRAERAFALELLLRARLQNGALDGTDSLASEIDGLAAQTGTLAVQGAAKAAAGALAEHCGDLEGARRCYEDAIDLHSQAGAPFETAIARRRLARVLHGLGREAGARREAATSAETFHRLGADHEAALSGALLHSLGLGEPATAPNAAGSVLSPRELEVLSLLAAGRANQEIAENLVLSIRTVERHVSTIYEKLGLGGPTARAAATAYAHDHGMKR